MVDGPPAGTDWIHETKWDGYRAIASVGGGRAVIRTRKGLDWTDKFAGVAQALAQLPCRSAVIDGELTVSEGGRTDFGALQEAIGTGKGRIDYRVFDLLQLDGEDLRRLPLLERKAKLKALLGRAKGLRRLIYSPHVTGGGDKAFARACRKGLEGIVSKKADAPYRSTRTQSWLKSKCGHAQEFVVIGWRPSTKAARAFASLLLAVREGGSLRYAGRVGTGYTEARLAHLGERFERLARKTSPARGVPPAIARQAHFIEPKLVAEIAFRGWTRDGLVRQGAFKGLRGDKSAREVIRETAMPKRKRRGASAKAKAAVKRSTPAARAADGAETIEGVRVTHPDRVLFAAQGVTKRALIDYYLAIADDILPHVAERPISLVRCPRGSGGACFFQKHASQGFPEPFEKIRIREKSGAGDYLFIRNRRGLVAAVQMGVLELHVWGCHVDDIEKPDRLVFDFDPDAGLDFGAVREAARAMRDRLDAVGLTSFPMVTGGKGVHVVVPLRRGHSWDEHRDFAEALARTMAQEEPERYVATMSKAKRRSKIFIDWLRNTRGATAIAPFSTRARPGAYVAMPVSWPQLARMGDAHPVHVGDAARFARRGDPWKDYFEVKQGLPLSKRGKL